MKKIEITLWSILVITLLMVKAEKTFLGTIVISGFVLSVFYFIFTYFLISKRKIKSVLSNRNFKFNKIDSIFIPFNGIVFSLSVISILFKLLHLPGSIIVLIISIFMLIIILIITNIKREVLNLYFSNLLYRQIGLLFILFALLLKSILCP